MYYGEPRLPTEEHIQLIDMATRIARLAIEAKRKTRASKEAAYSLPFAAGIG
jgi:hypothetical protein